MDELIAAIVLGILLGVGGLIFMAIGAWVRVARLERRVAALEARGTAAVAAPIAPAPGTLIEPRPVAPAAAAVAATAAPVTPSATSAPARPPTPPKPAKPATSADWEQRIAGRWLNRIGLLAVAIGMSYFLKYAIDNDWIGPTGQVAIGVLIGAALVGCGPWFIKRGYNFFADGLAGLGAVILYLSAWAATSYYHLLSPTVGFAFMIAITAGIIAIALGRPSQRVAMLGLLGGFLTPALVSTGRNAEVELFTYLALLNAGLLPIAWLRRWRVIEWPAFLFTLMYFAIWYGAYYTDAAIVVTTTFVVVFLSEFLVLPMIRARRGGSMHVEQTLLAVINPAVWLLALHAMYWPDHRWTLTALTLGLAALHLFVAQGVPANESGKPAPARILFAGIALVLVTVAIPMRLDGAWIGWAWAAEAAMLVWLGLRLDVVHMRTLGLLLLALVAFNWLVDPPYAETFLGNQRFGSAVALVVSLIVVLRASRIYAARVRKDERLWYTVVAVLINILALAAVTLEVHTYYTIHGPEMDPGAARLAEGLVISLLWVLGATGLTVAGVRTHRPALRWQGLALFGIVVVKVFFSDLADLRGLYRIASAIILGVLLLAVSFLYQRRTSTARPEEPSS
jgi:uncharacterized membrane protein